MTVSKQVLAQWVAHALALVAGYALARQGVHLSPTASAELAAGVSVVAGPLAGVLVQAEPVSASTVTSEVERLLAVLAESGQSSRSALSARPSVSAVVQSAEPPATQS